MKVLITEQEKNGILKLYGLLNEQDSNVYSDEKEYRKALLNYNKSLQIYEIYRNGENARKKYDEAIKKKYPNLKINRGNKFKTASSINDEFTPYIDWGSVMIICNSQMTTGFYLKYEKEYTISEWNSQHKNDPIKPIYFIGGGGHYHPVYKKPTKPILKKEDVVKPIIDKSTTNINVIQKEPTQQPVRTNPVTKFSVSWREDTPSGEVYQNTHYFSNYNEWKEFVTQYPHFSSKNENGSKTEAQALYGGLHADISKDKTYKST